MSRRTLAMIEIGEILYRWQQGLKKQTIAHSLGVSRNTVKKEIRQAMSQGLTVTSSEEEVKEYLVMRANKPSGSRKRGEQTLAISKHHDQIVAWLGAPHMTIKQIQRLLDEQGHHFPYSTLQHYVHHQTDFGTKKNITVHLETLPGEQAQVDFAYAGLLFDPVSKKMRKAHIFIMTLSYSRYRFVRFVFHQDTANWIDCHIHAFEFFQGVPKTILLDNLKAGVIKPNIYDPTINLAYAECERYYGFIADPAKIRVAKHKGKVERSVTIARQQLLAGRHYCHIHAANEAAIVWCRDKISRVMTTTTGEAPFERFQRDEKSTLLTLPSEPFECPTWQINCKVHFDHHVVFDGSFYSVPTRYIGQLVSVKGTLKLVQIYHHHELIKTHVRANRKGQWITTQGDYPKGAREFLEMDAPACREKAYKIGPSTGELIQRLLTQPSLTQRRKCQAILRLTESYPPVDLEAVCHQMVLLESVTYQTLRDCLDKQVAANTKTPKTLPKETGYVREPAAFSHADLLEQGEKYAN